MIREPGTIVYIASCTIGYRRVPAGDFADGGDAGYRLMTLNTVLMLGDVAHPRLLACLLLADYSLRVPVNVFDGHRCVVRRMSCFSLQVELGGKNTTQLRNAPTPIYGD